jgi:uncharacterized repeat protein (TIGR01451 family)
MTMVSVLTRLAFGRTRVDGVLRWAVLVGLMSGLYASAQQPPVHWLHAGAMPPGAIGSQRLHRDGPLSGYFQPVRVRAPEGARIAPAVEAGFGTAQDGDLLVGLQIGAVYRLQVTNIPHQPGVEIFPTIEVVDRTYPPAGLALRFPVPIELTQEDLDLAAQGMFVTRVIYVEDPTQALPVRRTNDEGQPWLETRPGDDPLVVADGLGRPIAILRIGGRVPMAGANGAFTYNSPNVLIYDAADVDARTPQARRSPELRRGPQVTSANVSSTVAAQFAQNDLANSTVANSGQPSQTTPNSETREVLQGQDIQLPPPQMMPIGPVPADAFFSTGANQHGTQSSQPCDCEPGMPASSIPWIGHGDEYLCDGGDFGSPAGVQKDWTVVGVEQEDAIAHYDTLDGRVRVTPSNRVCVYAPRFAAVRQVVNVFANEQPVFIQQFADELSLARTNYSQPVASSLQRHAVSVNLGKTPPILFRQREQPGEIVNLQGVLEVYDSLAPYANLQIIRLGQFVGREEALLRRSSVAAIAWTGDQAPQVLFDNRAVQTQVGVQQAGVIYHTDGPENPWLRLIKLASTGFAQPGDEVEFTLRYDNLGDQAIGNVTIIDSLATRLEYVPGSARSTADATFVVTPNEGGSTFLRWEIRDPLEPSRGGLLQFRARVR